MKFTIEGFSQEYALTLQKEIIVNGKAKRIKVDCNDLVILRWFVDFYPKMMKVEIEGKQYAWIKYQALLEDLPLLDIKKRMLFDRLQKLVDFGILSHKSIKSGGSFSYYGFGENYVKLIDDDFLRQPMQKNADGSAINCTPSSEIIPTVKQKIAEQIDSSIKNQSINNSSIINKVNVCIKEESTLETKKFKIGKFKNVLISKEELTTLINDYGEEDTNGAIEFLSAYIEEKGGYNSQSHYLAIYRWVMEAYKKTIEKPKKEELKNNVDPDGTFKNVYLSIEDWDKLINDGYTIDEIYDAVNFLSEYLHNNPNKKYKSHYKAIKDWVFTAMEERELKAQEIELKKQELAQRQERINQIDEKQKLVLASNGKRLCDLTQTEYEEYIQSQKPSGNKTIYNWLEKVEVEI